MKQENPNELRLWVFVEDDCPFTQSDARSLAEGEFLRARIKPTKDLKFYLDVDVSCLKRSRVTGASQTFSGYAIYADILFGTTGTFATQGMSYNTPNHSVLLTGRTNSAQFFKNGIEEQIEKALTDYLKANFGE